MSVTRATGRSHVTSAVAERAHQLLEENRVRLLRFEDGRPGAVVMGRTDDYYVVFTTVGVECECWPGLQDGEARCSHAVAALVAWEESRLALAAQR